MIYFALLDPNNVVVKVLAGRDLDNGKEEHLSARTGKIYKQACLHTHRGVYYDPVTKQPSADQSKAFRKNYPSVGFTYDPNLDAFIPPKPFESWVLDRETCVYEAPVPYPQNSDPSEHYVWDEDSLSWVLYKFPN